MTAKRQAKLVVLDGLFDDDRDYTVAEQRDGTLAVIVSSTFVERFRAACPGCDDSMLAEALVDRAKASARESLESIGGGR